MKINVESIGEVELPLNYRDGQNLSESERWEITCKAGALVLQEQPDLIDHPGDVAQLIVSKTGLEHSYGVMYALDVQYHSLPQALQNMIP